MIIGETLAAPLQGYTGVYFSPWFPRGGNAAIFQFDMIVAYNMSSVTVDIETKNTEDDDKDASSLKTETISSPSSGTRTRIEAGANLGASATAGFKELVRYKYALAATSGRGGFIHYRMLTPAWLSN